MLTKPMPPQPPPNGDGRDIPINPVIHRGPMPPQPIRPPHYLGPPVPAPPRKGHKRHRKHRKNTQPAPTPIRFSEDIPRANPVGGFGGVAPITAPFGAARFTGTRRFPIQPPTKYL